MEFDRKLAHKLQDMKRNDPDGLYDLLSKLPEDQITAIVYDPELWLRDNQIIKDDWPEPIIMVMAGRGLTGSPLAQ